MSAPLGKVAGGMIVPVNDFETTVRRLERVTEQAAAGEMSPNELVRMLQGVTRDFRSLCTRSMKNSAQGGGK